VTVTTSAPALDTRSLTLRNVSAGYGALTVLRGASLVVPPGHIVAVFGPNGAGKTTLLRSIFGRAQVRNGSIQYGRDELRGRPAHDVAKLGICYVTDDRTLFPSLTVGENLELFGRPKLDPSDRNLIYELFPVLAARRRQAAGTLSGGEQQMLALARAFVSGQTLVAADELSMGLAPIVLDHIFEMLRQLRDQGRSILLVEQYVERALEIADIAYVLWNGRIVFAGEPVELADHEELMSLYQTGCPLP
jgi:branched-chain amino acid transport system ATP-binding protein